MGGNSDNRTHVGTLYANLNNTPTNVNWNIGAAESYLSAGRKLNVPYFPYSLVKINSKQASASSVSKVDERIGCMKSYNHLWEKFIDEGNIRLAIQKSSKSKRKRRDVKKICENPEEWIPKIKAYAENFENKKHTPVTIYDGIERKKRTIIVPTYMEQVIHHMAVNVLTPIFMRGMYEHSYGSIPNRGAHKAKKVIEKWIRNDTRNVKYCLKMDIRKYFDSIPQDILKRKLAETIHDERFLSLLYELVGVVDHGIPLGFYTSQWLANWYLQGLDHYIKEDLQAAHYVRYMDDMVVFGSNKRKLHRMRQEVSRYLGERLGLSMKSNWQVFRFDYIKRGRHYGRCLDFMGFKFFRDRVILRKSIMLKAARKARRLTKKAKSTIYDIRQMLSYLGWLDCTDTYGMYVKWIKPYVCIRSMKRRMSSYDRRLLLNGA